MAVYYNVEGEPTGYMVYLIKDDVMHVKEMIYLNREAYEGLWEYIRAHDSMIDEVRGNSYFSDPIAFEMDDGDIREVIRPYIMGRIVDVERFLENYACDPNESGVRFAFEIEDEFLDWNNKTVTAEFRGGHCILTDEAPTYRLKLSIATLTTLLVGYKSALKLYRMGRIEADPAAVLRLDKAILHEAPYISDYI